MRNSRKREIILKTVQENRIHGTAAQIFDLVKKEIPEISLATVYRNLQQLSDLHLIRKFVAEDGVCRYDGCMEPHFHLLCDRCGAILDFEYDPDPAFAAAARERCGFLCSSLQVTGFGLCEQCRKALQP